MKPSQNTQFTGAEAQRRFEAALRGARVVGHESLKDKPKKRARKTEKGNKIKDK